MQSSETFLPARLLERATLWGNEYAWPISDIPEVIEAARQSNLVSVEGQLTFRFPSGANGECYWIEVDTLRAVPVDLPWDERVAATAAAALSQFQELQERYDFMAEGRAAFGEQFAELEASGGNPANAVCFEWYVKAKDRPQWR